MESTLSNYQIKQLSLVKSCTSSINLICNSFSRVNFKKNNSQKLGFFERMQADIKTR